jgi:hypothetical protein
MGRNVRTSLLSLAAMLIAPLAVADDAPLTKIPLVPGTVMVRAHESPRGDLEEIRVVQAVSAEGILLSRSAQVLMADGQVKHYSAPRFVRAEDMRSGRTYAFAIVPGEPERQPGATAIGLSTAIFDELMQKELSDAKFGFGPQPVDVVMRRFSGDESVDLLWNGERRIVPAIRTSTISRKPGLITAFATWYLNDRENPVGLRNETTGGPEGAPRVSQLVAINVFDEALRLHVHEQLAFGKPVDVYGFHFALGSNALREESVFAVKLLAAAIRDLGDRRLDARVHVDAAEGDAGEQRLQAIKAALDREVPEAAELVDWSTAGASEPVMTGNTLVSRAANRRVTVRPR